MVSSKEVKLISLDALMQFPILMDHYDKENGSVDFLVGIETILEYAQNLPTIKAELVVHGRWEIVQVHGVYTTFACSECSREVEAGNDYFGKPTEHVTKKYPYCHCGAKMEVDNV